MTINKVIFLFGIIFVVFLAIIYYQFHIRGIKQNGGQPQLPTGTVTIDKKVFTVEIAKTSPEQQMGLSDRPSLAANMGMIFVFNSPSYQSFWMKNMNFPLDIIFIDQNKIVYIAHNVPNPPPTIHTPPIVQPTMPSDTVLEINAGLSDKYGFKTGDTVAASL